jgi:DNA-binding MarR family transcriptional regulator
MKLFFKSILILITQVSLAQFHQGFRWISPDHAVFTVDNIKGNLYRHSFRGEVSDLGIITGWDGIKKELPGDYDINTFFRSDSLFATVPGTGLLFYVDISKPSLVRLDQTYFRGYNFNASQFIRKDTLFSIGGEGFWHKHSLITFYNFKSREWDYYKSINENTFPTDYKFSGFSKINDLFFSAYLNTDSVSRSKKIPFVVYDFNARKWGSKGYLSKKVVDFCKNPYRSLWTGNYLLLYSDTNIGYIFIIDPVANVLYQYDDIDDHFFLKNAELYSKSNYIYSGCIKSTAGNNKTFFDSLSVATIISKSKKVGTVYESNCDINTYLLAVLFFIIVLFLTYRYKRNKNRFALLQLSTLENKVIDALIQKYPLGRLSGSELNIILQIEQKNYDNQRQIRNRLIGTINKKHYHHFESKDLINRSPNTEDKRMMDYFINPEINQKELDKFKKRNQKK